MTLSEALQEIRSKINKFGDDLDNEEITKDVLIRPMIQALGYDSSDPTQVKAEYSVALPKGGRGRADYVIFHNGKPAIVMECKALGVPLDQKIQQQMLRYARALGAFAGIVTDGDMYLCFANVDDESQIDNRYYRSLVLFEPQDDDEQALTLLSKPRLFQKQLSNDAGLYMTNLDHEETLSQVLEDPILEQELFRLGGIEDSGQRAAALESTLDSLQQMIRDVVDHIAKGDLDFSGVFTTAEENEAYWLCKGIVHGTIDPHRVKFRDSKTYASVLIDDNNRKPLCRFHFNGRVKHIGTFDADKRESRHAIEDVDDLLKHARTLRRTARRYADQ
ncbi:MAG: type I restriction enzyme HsdR N-terminal domain-containing protein [Chloroflexi bacterium]|nr:type I restriction enzyme HsdR N-terminal domain-containing protein [Chloroflexota bacterium]MCY3696122.1 type I restriction enzyme HsdR N-terminal domain-containing protein [Chloroflexota bacterium]